MEVSREVMSLGFLKKMLSDAVTDWETRKKCHKTMLCLKSLPGPPNIHPEIVKDVMKYTN